MKDEDLKFKQRFAHGHLNFFKILLTVSQRTIRVLLCACYDMYNSFFANTSHSKMNFCQKTYLQMLAIFETIQAPL